TQNFVGNMLRMVLAASLVLGLAPAIANADTTVGVKVEAPAQVNETVAIGSSEKTSDNTETTDRTTSETTPTNTSDSRTTEQSVASVSDQIVVDVPLTPSDAIAETLLLDGLTFELNNDAKTATLTGWYGDAPKGDLSIPSQVKHGSSTYRVTSVGLSSDNADHAVKSSDTTSKTLGGGPYFPCPELRSVSLPSTVDYLAPNFFSGCPNLRSIQVSPQNKTYASVSNMVFTKDLTQLLSVPEGMEHTAYLPNTTDTVPAGAFSHSARLTSVSVGESSAAYSSENGILYNKDKTTLVAVPAGYGDAVVIPESVTSIAPQAFAGSALKSIVVLGRVVGIDPTSFTDGTKAEATVVIPSSSTYESLKAVWERAGFSHFQEPAKPGDVTAPKDASVASGFTYELLEDYTLSVSWRGSFEPEPDLVVPSSAQFNGVTYRISTIAASAFENCESLKTARISSSISRIEDAAFRGCAQLTECTLSDGLTSIGASAFESTALTQVILPESVAAVEDCAFAHNGELASIVALSDIASVASSALEGCSGVSILTPYQEDDLYPWTPGISALGNHIEPYGIDLASEYMTLEVGQSGDLFDKASIDLPKDCSFSFSYPAACISVDSDGSVAAKKEGAADVSASIMFDGVVLADASRSVVISPQANSSSNKNASTGELSVSAFTSPLPLVGTVFSLNGSTIAPRGVAIDGGTSGGCTWDITDGKLTIKPTNGASGTLESFGDGTDITAVPWRSNAAAITSVDVGSGVKGGASLAYMFEGCSNLTKLDLSKLET
ncbi:MAG: leucine-rich repeat protein, partial [Raoultibacter sp.]